MSHVQPATDPAPRAIELVGEVSDGRATWSDAVPFAIAAERHGVRRTREWITRAAAEGVLPDA